MAIKITDKICIAEDELTFKFSRSSGPGGQNVNKVNTKVTVFFDANACESFSDYHKKKVLTKLAGRADKEGVIKVASQRHRTQKANREAAVERLVELLQDALKRTPVRRKTKVPYGEKQKRLVDKKKRSLLKKQRTKVKLED